MAIALGQQTRTIKALSDDSDDDIAALLKGEGMGMAKAAELNDYPGPAHVLTLALELKLTENQGDFRSNERGCETARRRIGRARTGARPAIRER
jgi:hypothetical protein